MATKEGHDRPNKAFRAHVTMVTPLYLSQSATPFIVLGWDREKLKDYQGSFLSRLLSPGRTLQPSADPVIKAEPSSTSKPWHPESSSCPLSIPPMPMFQNPPDAIMSCYLVNPLHYLRQAFQLTSKTPSGSDTVGFLSKLVLWC